MVFYRKYRPQTLSDLMGQDSVKTALQEAFLAQKLSHAYLFVGPRGTGKTSTARILAKMINCTNSEASPCNKCEVCLSITDGSNMDLIEIDAASNRGIDDVRVLRENIKLSPSGQGKKVYIIDEVHMLTTEAFNALLKTLEEPPAHAIFILATTDVSKVPATILSRVTRLNFKLAEIADIIKALEQVATGEGLDLEKEALEVIAKKADGSFRDAVKLLDQVSTTGKVSLKDVSENLSVVPFDGVITILEALQKKDAKVALTEVSKYLGDGNPKDLTLQLMEVLRDLVLIKNGIEIEKDLKAMAEKFTITELVNILDKLQGSFEKLKFASISSLPLELAIVEVTFATGPASSVSFGASSLVSLAAASPKDTSSPSSVDNKSVLEPLIVSEAQTLPSQMEASSDGDLATLEEKWTFILETIRPYNFSLEALLRSTKIASLEDGVVTLEVPYSFHQRILEAPKSRDHLESVIGEVLGKPVRVTTVLGVRPQRIEDIANVELAADDEIITLAADIFNGKLVD